MSTPTTTLTPSLTKPILLLNPNHNLKRKIQADEAAVPTDALPNWRILHSEAMWLRATYTYSIAATLIEPGGPSHFAEA